MGNICAYTFIKLIWTINWQCFVSLGRNNICYDAGKYGYKSRFLVAQHRLVWDMPSFSFHLFKFLGVTARVNT